MKNIPGQRGMIIILILTGGLWLTAAAQQNKSQKQVTHAHYDSLRTHNTELRPDSLHNKSHQDRMKHKNHGKQDRFQDSTARK